MNKANKYMTNTPRSTTRATPSNKSYYQKGKENLGKNLRDNQRTPQDIPQRAPKRLQRNRGNFEDVLDYSLNQYSNQIPKNSPKHSSESLAKKYAKDYSKKNSKQSVRDVPEQPQKKTSNHSSGLYQRNTSKRRDNYLKRSDYVPKKSYEERSNKDYSRKTSRKPSEKIHEDYSNKQSRVNPRQTQDNYQENFFESPENVVNRDSEYYPDDFSEGYQEPFSEQYSEQQPQEPYYKQEDCYEGYSNEPYEDEYLEAEMGQAQGYAGQYQDYTGQYPEPEQQQEQYQGYSGGCQEEYPEMYLEQSEQYPEQLQEDYYGYDQIPENTYQQQTYDSDLGKGKGALRKVLSLSKFSKNSSGISLKYAGFAVFLVICLSILCFFQYPGSVLEVSGASMEPKFHSGDKIFASQWIGNINRFDIVVVSNENTENLSSDSGWIKRVIGLPGETIKYKNGNLYVNGKKIKQSFVTDNNSWFIGTEDFGPVTLGDDEYWVMGDNRSNSCDSRYVGAFKRDDIKYVYHFTIKELSDKDSN